MRKLAAAITMTLVVLLAACPVLGLSITPDVAGELGLGTLGGLAGAAIAITAISELAPQFEARAAKIATVASNLCLLGGIGGSIGVLAASKIWDVEGNVRGCLLGGLAGGLACAFSEAILYLFGIREGVTEFLGFVMLPILPAIGATIGFNE